MIRGRKRTVLVETIITPEQYIINELNKQREWINDLMKQMKPKKKTNKIQLKKDIFEIDFMCN